MPAHLIELPPPRLVPTDIKIAEAIPHASWAVMAAVFRGGKPVDCGQRSGFSKSYRT
jgi:hypothetical protein